MSPFDTFALLLIATLAIMLWIASNRRSRDEEEQREKNANFQRALNEQIEEARKDRNRLLNAITEAFLLIDQDGNIKFANQAANDLFHSQTLVNRTVREAFTDPRLAQALIEGIASKSAVKTHITLPQQASPRREQENRGLNSWVVDVAPLPNGDPSKITFRALIRDITSEQQTDQIRQDFVANASHELRTPMAIIQGYLENLLDEDMLEDEEMTRKFLGIMRKHSERMSRIVEDMLVISRLESGEESSLNIEPFSLKDCLQDILERLESLIQAQEATVELKLINDDITIQGDRFYWTQALFNLIENALKQNPRPGLKVEIGSDIQDNQLQVWVSDDGIGIPSADLPFVFRRFFRVDKHHTQSEIKGTGLGLSIVKRAIEAHQGTIEATSTPGIETKFLMTMPLQGPLKQASQLELKTDSPED